MESMSNTQKNPRFHRVSVWQVWTSVISELQFFLAVVRLFYVHDNTVHLTAEPPCQCHRVSVIRSSALACCFFAHCTTIYGDRWASPCVVPPFSKWSAVMYSLLCTCCSSSHVHLSFNRLGTLFCNTVCPVSPCGRQSIHPITRTAVRSTGKLVASFL